jgi:hypothetical protein
MVILQFEIQEIVSNLEHPGAMSKRSVHVFEEALSQQIFACD